MWLRERELNQVLSVLRADRLPRQSTILLVGAPGTGKTALLEETQKAAIGMGFHVSSLAASPEPATPPRQRVPGTELQPTDGGRAAAAGQPMLATVDDAHLVEPSRLAAAMRDTLQSPHTRVVWALALTPGAGVTGADIVRPDLGDAVTTVYLEALSDDAVREFVAEFARGVPSAELLAFVGQAAGNPMMVNQMVSGLLTEGRLRSVDGRISLSGGQIPRRVEELVQKRLRPLSVECRQLLQVASSLGQAVQPVGLQTSSQQPPAETSSLLEEATAAGILVHRSGEFAFSSPLIWRVVRQTVPAAMRSTLEMHTASVAIEERAEGPEPPASWRSASASPMWRVRERPYSSSTEPPRVGVRVLEKIPTQRPRRSVWDNFSATELAIARLVSDGLTNRQIAKRIYLSPHTVNYHLRRIFRKLDIASRVELATLANAYLMPNQ